MKEGNISKIVMMEASKHGARVFRNNRGMFFTLDMQRKVRAGLEFDGSSDLIGWTKDGKFLAIEVKRPKKTASDAQQKFIDLVRESGGIAFVATCAEDVKKNLETT